MNKVTMLASAALGALVLTGCASSKVANPVAEWQNARSCSETIAAKNTAATALTLDDVMYKSESTNPVISGGMNTVAAVAAPLYLKVVTAVDQLAANQEGRLIYVGVQNDIANGAKAEEILAAMPAEDKAAYQAYEASITQVDQESVMNDVVKPLLETLAVESAKIAATVNAIKADPAIKALAGLDMIRAGKDITVDADAISGQFADATAGANLWMDLLAKDKEAKAFMADYPVK